MVYARHIAGHSQAFWQDPRLHECREPCSTCPQTQQATAPAPSPRVPCRSPSAPPFRPAPRAGKAGGRAFQKFAMNACAVGRRRSACASVSPAAWSSDNGACWCWLQGPRPKASTQDNRGADCAAPRSELTSPEMTQRLWLRLARVRRRRALSLMKPAASFWS